MPLNYRLAIDGDVYEKSAWNLFLQSAFPSYEAFWLKHVIPLTTRPRDIHFKDDAALAAEDKNAEDIAIAQLHYTVLKHLTMAYELIRAQGSDELMLFAGLSALTASQDVAFELLQRHMQRGKYDPWKESPLPGEKAKSGKDARRKWIKDHNYPLQRIRDYRNKLIHGRMLPRIFDPGGIVVPTMASVEKYVDWRMVTNVARGGAASSSDFTYARTLLQDAWRETLQYLEESWRTYLLVDCNGDPPKDLKGRGPRRGDPDGDVASFVKLSAGALWELGPA